MASGLLFSLVALFLWLGFWQLDRAAQKQQAAIEQKSRSGEGRLRLSGEALEAESARYREVVVAGQFVEGSQFLLDNRKHKRVAGYHVMAPMHIEGSERAVLVNRGWVAQGKSRAEVPFIALPTGLLQLEGVVRVPVSQGFRLEQQPAAAVRLYLDLQQISQMIGLELLPFVVRQQSEVENSGVGDGLIRAWKLESRDSDPAMHYGYAVQWFAFALLLVGGWIAIVLKQRKESSV
ncbi:MAG: SURF1 family protein [Candidatus Marinimicrobia bacterium]|nr:SURF1 family protein [Candidatus Neomarinimicrobiota bacterium]